MWMWICLCFLGSLRIKSHWRDFRMKIETSLRSGNNKQYKIHLNLFVVVGVNAKCFSFEWNESICTDRHTNIVNVFRLNLSWIRNKQRQHLLKFECIFTKGKCQTRNGETNFSRLCMQLLFKFDINYMYVRSNVCLVLLKDRTHLQCVCVCVIRRVILKFIHKSK